MSGLENKAPAKRPPRAGHVITAAAAGLLFVILALEGMLRALPPPRYSLNWVYDEVIGHRGPRSELVKLPVIDVETQYNRFGFRGEDPTLRSVRRDQFSVFVFGDSITEAVQVPWRRAYARRLEYLLNERMAWDTEVTSWAISDYGTANELLAYATEAKALQPDVVLLQFLGLNDFVNNALSLAGRNKALSDHSAPTSFPPKLRGTVPEFQTPLGPEFPITYLHPSWKKWRERFRLLSYVDFFWTKVRWTQKQALLHEEPSTDFCATEVEVFFDQPSEAWQLAFEATGRLAAAWKAQVEQSQSGQGRPRLVAFYVPSYFEVYDPAWERGVELSLLRCFKKAYHRQNPEKRFLELFRAAGVEAVSLREAFLRSKIPLQKLYLSDGHLSSEGHRLVAETLAGLIERSPSARQGATSRGKPSPTP